MIKTALDDFVERVRDALLPDYCSHPKRQYSPAGFKYASIKLDARDASDCLRAIDCGIVKRVAPGKYRASLGTATETLFWEGQKSITPRPITLWLEAVITFAAMARLHFDFGWPIELIASQPRKWAFDLAAHDPNNVCRYLILGEVKKTVRETENLLADLTLACNNGSTDGLPRNAARKWDALIRDRPPTLWIVGPARYSKVFSCEFASGSAFSLLESSEDSLRYQLRP